MSSAVYPDKRFWSVAGQHRSPFPSRPPTQPSATAKDGVDVQSRAGATSPEAQTTRVQAAAQPPAQTIDTLTGAPRSAQVALAATLMTAGAPHPAAPPSPGRPWWRCW
jgi:hypothetical protein